MVHIYKAQQRRYLAKFYFAATCLGFMLSVISLIFFAAPVTPGTCGLQQWLFFFGISLMMSMIFSRTLQLKVISEKIQTGKWGTIKSFRKIAFVGFSVILAAQIVLLIIWTSVDPWLPQIVVSDPLNRVGYTVCASNNTYIWFLAEAVLYLAVCIYGLFVLYSTWKTFHDRSDIGGVITIIGISVLLVLLSAMIVGWIIYLNVLKYLTFWAIGFALILGGKLIGKIFIMHYFAEKKKKSKTKETEKETEKRTEKEKHTSSTEWKTKSASDMKKTASTRNDNEESTPKSNEDTQNILPKQVDDEKDNKEEEAVGIEDDESTEK